MSKIIKLTLEDKKSVYVNISLVFDFSRHPTKQRTDLIFGNDYVIMVLETPKEILNLLNFGDKVE